MTLEDHAGDVAGKARKSTGHDLDAVAKAAGVSVEAYARFEQSGQAEENLDFGAVGKLLGLNGERLERIAGGWLPPIIDTTQWRELRVLTTEEGMAVHNYLVWDEVTREAALFDTGWKGAPAFALIEENRLELKHLFITHTHTDHVAALGEIRQRFPKVRLHSNSKHAPVDQRNRTNDFVHLGSLRLTNRDTPGHADDGVTYLIGTFPDDAPNVAIVGDALFAGSMGGAGAHFELARRKVREQIFSLPDSTLICPGHGPLTTVGVEKNHNPFF